MCEHPGQAVRQHCMQPLGLNVTQTAGLLGVSRKTLSMILNGKAGITPEMAVRLALVFNTRAESWLYRQADYDLSQVDRYQIRTQVRPLPGAG